VKQSNARSEHEERPAVEEHAPSGGRQPAPGRSSLSAPARERWRWPGSPAR
jgi:hypothetical protein